MLFDTIGDDGVGGGEGGGDCSHALAVVMQQGRCVTFSLRTCLAYSLSHSAPQFVAALLWLVVGVPQPMSLLMCVFLNVFLEVFAMLNNLCASYFCVSSDSCFRCLQLQSLPRWLLQCCHSLVLLPFAGKEMQEPPSSRGEC